MLANVGRVVLAFGKGAMAFALLQAVLLIAVMLAYPIGGQQYHAIFAYSGGGRVAVALQVAALYMVALGLGTTLLIWLRYPLSWITLATLAAVVGGLNWVGVVQFPWASWSFRWSAVAMGRSCRPVSTAWPLWAGD